MKWTSEQPAFAAFEILRYGLDFLFAYVNQRALGYQEKTLMGVEEMSLRVLAPRAYDQAYNLSWLAAGPDAGIRFVAKAETNGALSMDFGFMAFPVEFELPFKSGADVVRMRTEDTKAGRAVVSAIRDISPIWTAPL